MDDEDTGLLVLSRRPNQSYNGDGFIDLFCTHLQANQELPAFGVPASTRAAQISELMTFANQGRAPDRPALLMGDFNINGKEWPHQEYASLLANLGISQLTAFDQNNSFLSKRYDFDLHDLHTTVASDLSAAQQAHGSIGEGPGSTSSTARSSSRPIVAGWITSSHCPRPASCRPMAIASTAAFTGGGTSSKWTGSFGT